MAKRIKKDYSTQDFYDNYLSRTENKSKYFKLDKKKYTSVLKTLNETIANNIMSGEDMILPFGFHIRIKKMKMSYKQKSLKVNWKETKELWEKDEEAKLNKTRLFYLNEHSDGYSYRWYWDKYRCVGKNKSAYSFIPSRDNKVSLGRGIIDKIKNNKSLNYFE